jgi:Tetratricopeptide repeat
VIERLLEAERDLSVGLVDRAEAIYHVLAESDPRNAVAVVGLARCALEHGDERGAYDLAVRALSIDPDEAVALRMEARLSEILATRGRPVERPAFVREPADDGTGGGTETRSEPRGGGTSRADAGEPQGARRGLLRRMLGRR